MTHTLQIVRLSPGSYAWTLTDHGTPVRSGTATSPHACTLAARP